MPCLPPFACTRQTLPHTQTSHLSSLQSTLKRFVMYTDTDNKDLGPDWQYSKLMWNNFSTFPQHKVTHIRSLRTSSIPTQSSVANKHRSLSKLNGYSKGHFADISRIPKDPQSLQPLREQFNSLQSYKHSGSEIQRNKDLREAVGSRG